MANEIITPSIIAKEALVHLENNMVMGNIVNREYKKEFVKVGGTINVRKPVRFRSQSGANRVNQDVTEQSITFNIDRHEHVSWEFSAVDLTLSIEEYSKRYIEPAMIALADKVDRDLCALYKDVPNAVGTAGTTPASYTVVASAMQKLNEFAVPKKNRYAVFNPAAEASLADALKGLYNEGFVKDILKEASIGRLAKFDLLGDQNIYAHTAGESDNAGVVNGANQEGSSLAVTFDAGTTFKKGDIITIAGVNAVNPVNGQSTGALRQFVITADATADGSGNATLSISPSIVSAGAYQTVSAVPASGAVVTRVSDHIANLAFHEDAFGLVFVPIELPDGASWKARESGRGMSVTVVKDFDIDTYKEIIRLDILYGVKTFYEDFAVRILG